MRHEDQSALPPHCREISGRHDGSGNGQDLTASFPEPFQRRKVPVVGFKDHFIQGVLGLVGIELQVSKRLVTGSTRLPSNGTLALSNSSHISSKLVGVLLDCRLLLHS